MIRHFQLTTLLLLIFASSSFARTYWVYMTPGEAKALYVKSEFQTIKAEADNHYINANYLNHPLVAPSQSGASKDMNSDLAKALEVTSVTYFVLLHGVYDGVHNSALDPYLETAVQCWNDIRSHGPADLWVCDSSSGTSTVGWSRGDIALREWLTGAYPSYDLIRDYISSTDKNAIDNWMLTIAQKMFVDQDYATTPKHNRYASKMAQAAMFMLILQRQSDFEQYYFSTDLGGLKGLGNPLSSFFNHAPKETQSWFAHRPGFSWEHDYKTGVYGRAAMEHAFHLYFSVNRAADNGGRASWKVDRAENKAFLNEMLNSWYDWATVDRNKYITYCNNIEMERYNVTSVPGNNGSYTYDSKLNAELWMSFAFLQNRFASVNYWKPDNNSATLARWASPACVVLWKIRAQFQNGTFSPTAIAVRPGSPERRPKPASDSANRNGIFTLQGRHIGRGHEGAGVCLVRQANGITRIAMKNSR